jgi:hypothetical protein
MVAPWEGTIGCSIDRLLTLQCQPSLASIPLELYFGVMVEFSYQTRPATTTQISINQDDSLRPLHTSPIR